VHVDAMLCDHAETSDGKLFINGAAINLLWVGPQPPHVINLGVAVVVHVPYTDTNQPHQIRVTIVDEDGDQVVPWVPEGAPAMGPVEIAGDFNVGRPAALAPGESQSLPFAFQMTGLPMPHLGLHSVVIAIDGVEARRLPFRVSVQQG
jgi:hypothetical protein